MWKAEELGPERRLEPVSRGLAGAAVSIDAGRLQTGEQTRLRRLSPYDALRIARKGDA